MSRAHATVLVVDDDAASRDGLAALLERWGYKSLAAADGSAALKACEQNQPEAMVVDLIMPEMNGLQLIEKLGDQVQQIAVIMLTGQATIESAVQAIKLGAYEYLTKPLDAARLRAVLEKGLKHVELTREVKKLVKLIEGPLGYRNLIGKSPLMRQLYQNLTRVAATEAPVLVSGESGTGKELVARTLHDLSPRSDGPFLALNCAAIPPTLMESEILGHEKGAFTGALERRLGCFEQADGGTLLLDEITEMAPEVQAKFLRVLEEKEVRRVGATSSVPVSVRVVTATNLAPAQAVKDGKLRSDLFYRLSVFHLELPPLRDRGDDITLLAHYFLDHFAEKYSRPVLHWAPDFVAALKEHPWAGNVRELRNSMEQLAVLAGGPVLTAADLKKHWLSAALEDSGDGEPVSLAEAERQAIERALAATGGNKTQAAKLLGITTKTLNAKLTLYRNE